MAPRSDANLDLALALAAAGLWVFPTVDKLPVVKRFTKPDTEIDDAERKKAIEEYREKNGSDPCHVGCSRDPKAIRKMWRAYPNAAPGISTGPSNLVVFDPDKKDDGPDKLVAFFKEHSNAGITSDVPITRTPGGGLHIFFRNEPGLKTQPTEFKKKYGTDIKGIGGYVVAPDAELPDGRKYEAVTDGRKSLVGALLDGVLPPPPEWLLAEVTRCGAKVDAEDPLALPSQLTKTARDVPPWLRSAMAAIPNEDIDYDQWVKIGAAVHHETGGSDEGRELFEEWSAQSGKHDDEKFEKTWSSYGETYSGRPTTGKTIEALARKHGWQPAGVGAAADDDYGMSDDEWRERQNAEKKAAAEKTAAENTRIEALLQPYAFTDIDQLPPRQFEYGRAYLRSAVSLLGAFGGRGKSLLLITEALAMASGKALLGVTPTHKLRVLLWNGEDTLDELKRRVGAAMRHHGITQDDISDRLIVVSGHDLPICIASEDNGKITVHDKQVASLRAKIKRHGVDVLMMDPLISLHRLRENDNTAMDVFTKTLAKLAVDTNISLGLATHVRKPSGKDELISGHDIRGAGAVSAAVRIVRVINPLDKKTARSYGIQPGTEWQYSVVSDEKGNYAPRSKNSVLVKTISLEAKNAAGGFSADSNPVLVQFKPTTVEIITPAVLDDLVARLKDEDWLASPRGRGAARWAGALAAELAGEDVADEAVKARLKAELDALERRGVLVVQEVEAPNRKAVGVYRPGKVPERTNWAADEQEDEPL